MTARSVDTIPFDEFVDHIRHLRAAIKPIAGDGFQYGNYLPYRFGSSKSATSTSSTQSSQPAQYSITLKSSFTLVITMESGERSKKEVTLDAEGWDILETEWRNGPGKPAPKDTDPESVAKWLARQAFGSAIKKRRISEQGLCADKAPSKVSITDTSADVYYRSKIVCDLPQLSDGRKTSINYLIEIPKPVGDSAAEDSDDGSDLIKFDDGDDAGFGPYVSAY